VLGLMPHPENAVLAQQHPRWTREPWRERGDGLAIFENAIAYARAL
jgi:phosphoribosylformylglycinamidine synthase subunit PurQ / glutaminase